MPTNRIRMETGNHAAIMESVKRLAASSKQPLVVIDGGGEVLYVNDPGEKAIKMRGRSPLMRKLLSFFSPVTYLAHNDNFFAIESIADFRTKDSSLHICLIRS